MWKIATLALAIALASCAGSNDGGTTSDDGDGGGASSGSGGGGDGGGSGGSGGDGGSGSGANGGSGSGGGGGGGGGSSGPQPGVLRVSVKDVSGLAGKILVGFVYTDGGPGMATAGLCTPITTSPFSVSEAVRAKKAGDGNPCDLEATKMALSPGTYNVLLQVFAAGSMAAEKCAQMTAEVDGDVTVEAPALGACP